MPIDLKHIHRDKNKKLVISLLDLHLFPSLFPQDINELYSFDNRIPHLVLRSPNFYNPKYTN